jgi:PAS domain S-box-containing protein
MIKKIWLHISNQGINRSDNAPETRRLRLTNQFVFLAALITALYSILCYAWGMYKAFYLETALSLIFILLFLNNGAGRIPLSRYIFVFVINLQALCLCLLFGQRSQMHLLFIPVAAVPFVLFGLHSAWRALMFSGLTIILLTTLFVIRFSSFLSEIITPEVSPYLELSSIIISIICELIIIYSFISTSDEIEQSLDENNSFLQSQLKAIFDNSQDALFLVEAESKKIIKANRRAVEVFEMDAEEDFYVIAGHNLHKHEMPAEQYDQMIGELNNRGIYETEILYLTKKGREFWGALSISMIIIQGDKYQSVRVTDIHAQKLSRETTQAALNEKEVLLAEIHHRVKNNMAVISALLGLQSGYTEDEKAKKLFEESRNRIHTMALIHEKLYKHESLSKIEFGLYIHDLVAHIERSHNFIGTHIRFSVLCTDVFLDIKSAVPCGLILNELVTNACKHAFKGRSEGKIRIDCIKTDNKILLQVSDNGIGFHAAEIAASSRGGLGMTLIEGLVEQLNGELSISHAGGTRYSVIFELGQG